MANVGPGNFAGSFLQAFTAAQQAKQDKDLSKQEIQARLKLYEVQLQREQQQNAGLAQQQAARAKLDDLIGGAPAGPSGTGLQSPEIPGISAPARPPMSLTDLLSDPKGSLLLMQSGLGDLKDIATAQNQAQTRAFLQQLTGQGTPLSSPVSPAIPGPGIPPVGASAPGGFELSGIKFDTSGNPMFDLSKPTVKNWQTAPNGLIQYGYDDSGKVIATRPAAPNDRAPEDVPLPASELLQYRLPNGQTPSPGMTRRQLTDAGATTVAAPAEADKRASLLFQGMDQAESTIKDLNGADTSSLFQAGLNAIPGAKLLTSSDFRKYRAAGLRWAQNYLYLKSGANQSENETKATFESFFPQPGDSDEVKAQKNLARQQETQNVAQIYAAGQGKLQGAQLPAGIPPGSKQIGTSGGKPVYQAPNGKQYIVN